MEVSSDQIYGFMYGSKPHNFFLLCRLDFQKVAMLKIFPNMTLSVELAVKP